MSFISLPIKPEIIALTHNSTPPPLPETAAFGLRYRTCALTGLHRMSSHASVVIAWLMSETYDAYDVAAALVLRGFKGRCIFVSPKLPSKALVLAELKSQCGLLNCDIWFEDEAEGRAEALAQELAATRSRELAET